MNRISKKLNRKAEINENAFDSLRDNFYEGTKKYFDREEQDKIWNGEYYEEAAKNLNENEMDKFLYLLNKYGLIKDYHECLPVDDGCSYLEMLLGDIIFGNENCIIITKKWQDYVFKNEIYCNIAFFAQNCCGWSDSKLKYIFDNFSKKVLGKLNEYAQGGDDDGVDAAMKTYYSDNKILTILDGFNKGLSVEEIKNKIKEELPKNEW